MKAVKQRDEVSLILQKLDHSLQVKFVLGFLQRCFKLRPVTSNTTAPSKNLFRLT